MPTNCARSRAFNGNFSNCNCFGRQTIVLTMTHSISARDWLWSSYLNEIRRLSLGRHLDEGPIQISLQCQESTADVLVMVFQNEIERKFYYTIRLCVAFVISIIYTFCRYFVNIIPENAIREEIIIASAYRVVQLTARHVLVEYDGEIMILLVRLKKLIELILIVKRSDSFANIAKNRNRKNVFRIFFNRIHFPSGIRLVQTLWSRNHGIFNLVYGSFIENET